MADRTVAEQIRPLAVPVPANTLVAAPLVTAWDLGHTTLTRLEVAFTRGASFLVGVQFLYSGTLIVPWSPKSVTASSAWVIGSDETVPIPINFDVDGGLVVQAYNLDPINFHTIYLRAYVIENATLGTVDTGTANSALVLPSTAQGGDSGNGMLDALAGAGIGSLNLDSLSVS